MAESQNSRILKTLALVLVVLIVGLYAGYTFSSYNSQSQETLLYSRVTALESQIASLQSGSSTIVYMPASLNSLYESVKDSIVTIEGIIPQTGMFGMVTYSEVLGSGFVVNLTGTPVIITNFHVIDGMINGSVTFINGDAYPFTVLGKDKYSDLAVLQPLAPADSLKPLTVVSSKTVMVGDSVAAIGNPYGLQSSLTLGIVSQLNRAIQTDSSSSYLIAGIIQIDTPINPGNSGGPLLDTQGRVVGITTAIISGSDNIGFAVPSDAIIKEIHDLVTKGSYNHPYLGINGVPLNYLTSTVAGLNVTYGVLIQTVTAGSPASSSGLRGGTQTVTVAGGNVRIGGDVIIQVDGQLVRSMDDLTSYLEENTIPGQTVNMTVIRGGNTLFVPVVLGIRS
jgi:S1-C subfamily serine protease